MKVRIENAATHNNTFFFGLVDFQKYEGEVNSSPD